MTSLFENRWRPPGARRWAVVLAIATAVATAVVAAPTAASAAPAAPTASSWVRACAAPAPNAAGCQALRRTKKSSSGVALATSGPTGLDPADFAAAYHLNTSGGAGQTVAVVDAYDDPNAESDLAVYRSQFGLPACTTANGCFTKVNQNGATSPLPAVGDPALGWGLETSLDLDMVSAVCSGCHILLVETNSQSMADLYSGVDEAAANTSFVSNSWGFPEYSTETNDDTHFNHPDKVIAFASGDNGQDGGVIYPAASRYVVAVGGTSLHGNTSSGFSETAWSGAGSGCSTFETAPGWQSGPPATQCSKRAVADVSADADPDTGASVYDTIDDGGWDVAGGTSEATPIITAVFALAGTPAPNGPPSFFLYRHFIGRGPNVVPTEHVFNDVTSGSNGDCGAPTCAARTGWDGPTGVGTPFGTGGFVLNFPFGAVIADSQATQVNTSASLTLQGTDGVTPYTWAATGLPPGLSLNTSTGVISGTPTTVGTYTVSVTGHDVTASPPGSYTFRWVINAPTTATVPLVLHELRAGAEQTIKNAGLTVGSETTAVDCNNIGEVISQSPSAGTQVAVGSSVNIVVGVPSAKPCP